MFQARDLFDDRLDAFFDNIRHSRCSPRQTSDVASNPFGGELDRSERILDFMSKTPGNFAPCVSRLRSHNLTQVFNDQHKAAGGQLCCGHDTMCRAAGRHEADLPCNRIRLSIAKNLLNCYEVVTAEDIVESCRWLRSICRKHR